MTTATLNADLIADRQQNREAAYKRICPRCDSLLRLTLNPLRGEPDASTFAFVCEAPRCGFVDQIVRGERLRSTQKFVKIARAAAHDSFDDLWQEADELYGDDLGHPDVSSLLRQLIRCKARRRAYSWLAHVMSVKEPHFSNFSIEQCVQTIHLCRSMTPALIREWAKLNPESLQKSSDRERRLRRLIRRLERVNASAISDQPSAIDAAEPRHPNPDTRSDAA